MIVIPMAGLSQRFIRAGYPRPKHELLLRGRTVFAHAVASFADYADRLPFLFIARATPGIEDFIRTECAALRIADPRIVLLDSPTAGQAETVALGLQRSGAAPEEPITIFNIDTFRPGFHLPEETWAARSDGYLEVFEGSGDNWSYVGPVAGSEEPRVAVTTEKKPISTLCCTGLYHFRRTGDFHRALASERAAPSSAELYVAPLYNHLISAGQPIHYVKVAREAVVFCGVPDEYEALRMKADRGR